MDAWIFIETTRYSEFFRQVLGEYSEDVSIEIDRRQYGADDIPRLLKEWCTNRKIRGTRDFMLRRGNRILFWFHDHPRELYAALSEREFVERLEREKVLRHRLMPLKEKKSTGRRLLDFWPFTPFWTVLIVLVPVLCTGCNRDPDAVAAKERMATTAKLRRQLSGITLQDGISQSEAEIIANFYFDRNVGCGAFNGIRDGGSFWIVNAQSGLAGTPVNGFHIDKVTGKILSPSAQATRTHRSRCDRRIGHALVFARLYAVLRVLSG